VVLRFGQKLQLINGGLVPWWGKCSYSLLLLLALAESSLMMQVGFGGTAILPESSAMQVAR
jgi:hypothetical protein